MPLIPKTQYYVCNTLIHRGEILERIVRKYHPNLSELAKKLGYESRSTIYRQFKKDDLEDSIIIKYAKAIKYNFKDEFPDLYKNFVLNEPEFKYVTKTKETLEAQMELYKDLYMQQLAENNRLLQELMAEREKKK